MNWSVPRSWEGETCVILAGGPSLRGFDASILRPKHQPFEYTPTPRPRVITINDSWRIFPRADVHYFCERSWRDNQVNANKMALDRSIDFAQLIYRGFWVNGDRWRQFADHPHVRSIGFNGQQGLSTDPAVLRHGSNSGYATINLAYLFGAKRILLLGYDMKVLPNRTHWHDEPRPDAFGKVIEQSFLPHFPTLVEPLEKAGVEVINCTPDSGLKCWPYLPLEEALALPAKNLEQAA